MVAAGLYLNVSKAQCMDQIGWEWGMWWGWAFAKRESWRIFQDTSGDHMDCTREGGAAKNGYRVLGGPCHCVWAQSPHLSYKYAYKYLYKYKIRIKYKYKYWAALAIVCERNRPTRATVQCASTWMQVFYSSEIYNFSKFEIQINVKRLEQKYTSSQNLKVK